MMFTKEYTYTFSFVISPMRLACFWTAMLAVCLFRPEIVAAAVAFGEIGENVAENAKGVASGIIMGGNAAGVGMGVWGCVDMYKAGRNQGQATYGGGITKILIGAILLGLGGALSSGSMTMFGSDQTSGFDELGL